MFHPIPTSHQPPQNPGEARGRQPGVRRKEGALQRKAPSLPAGAEPLENACVAEGYAGLPASRSTQRIAYRTISVPERRPSFSLMR